MAAYCSCCGAEILARAEACPVCGTPRHGMMPSGLPVNLADNAGSFCRQRDGEAKDQESRVP